jgi:hypothetical protein
VTLPTDFSFKYGNPQVTYDKAAQRLTLIIRSDDLMAQAYWNVPGVGVLTDAVWFNAWIAPAGQYGKMIKGTLSRSDTGVWTIVFEGLPSGYGGSMYIVHTDATQSWQNVGGFRYSTGINVHVDASKGEGWYIMP